MRTPGRDLTDRLAAPVWTPPGGGIAVLRVEPFRAAENATVPACIGEVLARAWPGLPGGTRALSPSFAPAPSSAMPASSLAAKTKPPPPVSSALGVAIEEAHPDTSDPAHGRHLSNSASRWRSPAMPASGTNTPSPLLAATVCEYSLHAWQERR